MATRLKKSTQLEARRTAKVRDDGGLDCGGEMGMEKNRLIQIIVMRTS